MKKKWIVDTSHSNLGFCINHLNISKIFGCFNDFSGQVLQEKEKSFQEASFSLSANSSSVYTKDKKRDERLRSLEFLNSAAYPKITFYSENITQLDRTHYIIEGTQTIKGIRKSISLTAHFGGSVQDQNDNNVISFEITGQLLSTDFGMQWYEETPQGVQIWSNTIELHLYLKLIDS